MTKAAPAAFKLPKSLAACADALYTTRAERLQLNKEVEALAAREALLREHLITNLPKSQATGVSGKVANAKIETSIVVRVEDWDAFHAYLRKETARNPGAWALMQKRVGDAAVKELWAAGKTVPGLQPLRVPVVSCTKVG